MTTEGAGQDQGSAANAGAKAWPRALAHVEDVAVTLARAFPELRRVVDRVVYEGVTLLAGRPKLGKSWLALTCALAVASGELALGGQAVEVGDVLYLALEDGQRRLQRRLRQLLGDRPPPRRLKSATRWLRFDQGGLGDLATWVLAVPQPRLIVIDTLKRVRPPAGKQGRVYDEDYDALAPLTDLAAACPGLAILVVHHTRKTGADDVLDEISGSTGLTGAVDGAIVLRGPRLGSEAELHVSHRDAEADAVFTVKRAPGDPAWRLTGEVDPEDSVRGHMSPQRRAILALIEAAAGPVAVGWVARQTWSEAGDPPQSHLAAISYLLRGLLKDGCIASPKWGHYQAVAPPAEATPPPPSAAAP